MCVCVCARARARARACGTYIFVGAGKEKPYCVCCFNDVDGTRPPPLDYLTKSEPIKEALSLLGSNLDGTSTSSAAAQEPRAAASGGAEHGSGDNVTQRARETERDRETETEQQGEEAPMEQIGITKKCSERDSTEAAAPTPSHASLGRQREPEREMERETETHGQTIRTVAGKQLVELLADQGINTIADLANQPGHLATTLDATGLVSEREVSSAVAKAKALLRVTKTETSTGRVGEAADSDSCATASGDRCSAIKPESLSAQTVRETQRELMVPAAGVDARAPVADPAATATAAGASAVAAVAAAPAAAAAPAVDGQSTAGASAHETLSDTVVSDHEAQEQIEEAVQQWEKCPAVRRNKHPETGLSHWTPVRLPLVSNKI